MLRRAFLALSLSLAAPAVFKRATPRVASLGEANLQDLPRLKIYSLTTTGKRISHKIHWYGEFYNGSHRHVAIRHSVDLPNNVVVKMVKYEIDGVLVGFDGEPDNLTKPSRKALFGSNHKGFLPPTAIRVDQNYSSFYTEVAETIALYGLATE